MHFFASIIHCALKCVSFYVRDRTHNSVFSRLRLIIGVDARRVRLIVVELCILI